MQRILGVLSGGLLAATMLAPAGAQAIPSGSYQQSCSNIRVRGDRLSATCNLPQGGTQRSSISVSSCGGADIANSNGQLVCSGNGYGYGNGYGNGRHRDRYDNGGYNNGRFASPPAGSYQSSCTNVRMRGSRLSASCSAPNGNSITSSLSVTQCRGSDIANVNGYLRCGNGYYNGGYNGGYNNGRYNGGYNGYGRGYGRIPAGSYQSSCTNARIRGSLLTATCTSANGNQVNSSLNVSSCNGADIANRNGYLSCG